jgi:hypothetical protein
MLRWLPFVAVTALVFWLLFRQRRAVRPPAPALKLAGGPPDEAADDPTAGRPLLHAITVALRARGYQAGEVADDDWGYLADAIVAGRRVTLKLGAHGQNGVGREWLLVVDGAEDHPALRQAIEDAAGAVDGVRVLGWDD